MSKVNEGETKKPLHCTFCGKDQHEVRKLIAGPTVFTQNWPARVGTTALSVVLCLLWFYL